MEEEQNIKLSKSEKNKIYQKEYNKNNSDTNKIYQKEYYKKNKPILLAKANEKIVCDYCYRKVSRCRMIKHKTTNLCMITQHRNIIDKRRKEEI